MLHEGQIAFLMDNHINFNFAASQVSDLADSTSTWTLYLECLPADRPAGSALPPFDKDSDVLLFFKLYDPRTKQIHYCGHEYISITSKVRKYARLERTPLRCKGMGVSGK